MWAAVWARFCARPSSKDFSAEGLEISSAMCAEAERRYGVRPHLRTIEEFESEKTFDVIVMNAVIEHVHNPDTFVAAARRLVAPGGVLYIDTPREPHLLTMVGRAMGRTLNLSPTWPPYHVFGFNPKALSQLLAKHSFSLDRTVVKDSRAAAPGAARLVMKVANFTPWAANMYCWARPV